MMHDIAHCKGTDCDKKKQCYRYLAYTEVYDGLITIYASTKDCINNNHKNFIEALKADYPKNIKPKFNND